MTLFTPGPGPAHAPLTLRPYQCQAVDAVYRHLRERDDHPCVVMPTGSGKTPVIATICSDSVNLWGGRVLILAHVKELLEQAFAKLDQTCPGLHVGIHSAGLGRRDTEHPVILAGIQSVHQKAQALGPFDLVLVDEAHMIPPDGDGMYRRFLDAARGVNPRLRVIGLTATPFRMSSGPICAPPPAGILNTVCFEVGVRELIRDGYLSPLRSKAGLQRVNTDALHVRGGEFVPAEVEKLMDGSGVVDAACAEIAQVTRDRRSVLVFCAGVRHGQHVAQKLERVTGQECGFVDGDTPPLHRDTLIRRFREGSLKFLANVNVLTTGFDAPGVDCVVLLRPTMSPGLYYQMVGRGFRLSPETGKTDCLVLDFGGNVLRHGPVDQLRVDDPAASEGGPAPAKECPSCQALIATGYAACPDCGHIFPPPKKRQHDASAGTAGILAGQVTLREHEVREVFYRPHTKRDAAPGSPRTLRVEYRLGYQNYFSEWVCLEHSPGSFPRLKAEAWWRARSHAPVPDSVDEAVRLAEAGALAPTLAITVRSVAGEKYDQIVRHQLGERPAWAKDQREESIDESDLPAYAAPAPGSPEDDDIPF